MSDKCQKCETYKTLLKKLSFFRGDPDYFLEHFIKNPTMYGQELRDFVTVILEIRQFLREDIEKFLEKKL